MKDPDMTRTLAIAALATAALAGCTAETTSSPQPTATPSGGAPQIVLQKCEERFGETARIDVVSPLRPGFYEVMMGSFRGSRKAACTADSSGRIVDWVDL